MAERDPSLYGSPGVIDRVLDDSTTWFVVGLGNNPDRDAFGIARLLQSRGKRIVPIYPRAETVHGEQGFATIAEAVAAVGVPDVVDMFVRSDRVGSFVDEAIAAGAGAVWLQLGVIDEAAARRAVDAGLDVVMDNCPAIVWGRR
ncbi:MAG: CoA-binding protein [Actinomycetales bacterium mxb001]|nr:MAG: CoA-binding protein [Actinomycetales bacterium mxb001]